jgi:flavodoxin, long chain
MTVMVIYGTDSGSTKTIASRIAKKIGGKALDIKSASTADLEGSDLLILGSPTYGEGDLQCDWEDNLQTLKSANIASKKVALFGTGDQASYPDSFVNALGTLYDHVVEQGAVVVGFTETDGYSFKKSTAVRDGKFVGLVLDQDGQASMTDGRITSWISNLV